MDLTNKSQLIDYLKQHNLWAKKGLSQNFLVDKNALDKIVEAAELKEDDLVVEIGPGLGTLTQELVSRAGEVVAVEMDEVLATLLPEMTKLKYQITNKIKNDQNPNLDLTLEIGNLDLKHRLRVINSDILKLNLNDIIGTRPYKVVANIPYHITSKILELFLSREQKPELIVLLVQKEVAERVCAKPGQMSVLALSVQLYGKPEIIGIVPKESFFPSPKVDSAILKVDRIQISDNSFNEKEFFRLVHIGFAAKRKTLVNNLMVGYQLERGQVVDILKEIGLKETVRAQELSIGEWKQLAGKINC